MTVSVAKLETPKKAPMPNPTTAKLQIAVLDRGFVYVGLCRIEGTWLVITGSQNVRLWGTTSGLGQLAMSGPTVNTELDVTGTVRAPLSALIHLIDANPEAWPTMAQGV